MKLLCIMENKYYFIYIKNSFANVRIREQMI